MAKIPAAKKAATKELPKTLAEENASPVEQATGLQTLFEDGIKGLYWSEKHIEKSLPKMIDAAGAQELQSAFTEHLKITVGHVARLEEVFTLLGKKAAAKKCDAVEGLAMDGEHIIESTVAGTDAREAGLIMAGRKVENYEMTAYNGLIELATKLGKDEVAALLLQTLEEEQEADKQLAAIAGKSNGSTNDVNVKN